MTMPRNRGSFLASYFSLSERGGGNTAAVIKCVMWRSDAERLSFIPSEGMEIIVTGTVRAYAPHGTYQLQVKMMRKAGIGEKFLLVEQWKRQLAAEGCFSLERKRCLPAFPARIGVVTSETGAVIHDIRTVMGRRYPLEIIISPTAVQGEQAHREIAAAISRLAGMVDVVIVARGGGSFEDLFPFNPPDVVRAIVACPIPVVSAIGHEVDVTLSDLAADLRAPTPSVAAELVVPDRLGLTPDGRDSTNPLSSLLLRSKREFPLNYPDFAARVHARTPEPFLHEICETIKEGTGIPKLFFDEEIIPLFLAKGAELEEANDYCIAGCTEAKLLTRDAITTGCAWVNLGAILEMALNDGRIRRLGAERIGAATGDARRFTSFDDVWLAFRRQAELVMKHTLVQQYVADTQVALRRLAALLGSSVRIGNPGQGSRSWWCRGILATAIANENRAVVTSVLPSTTRWCPRCKKS